MKTTELEKETIATLKEIRDGIYTLISLWNIKEEKLTKGARSAMSQGTYGNNPTATFTATSVAEVKEFIENHLPTEKKL